MGLKVHGDRFQAGDSEALACLATTLVKLNTGLVEIIGSLLDQSRHQKNGKRASRASRSAIKTNSKPSLDYARLAILSEASRIETCQSLIKLRQRLTRQLSVAPESRSPVTVPANIKVRTGATKRKSSPVSVSKPVQWAVIRTRPKVEQRKASMTSASSGGSPILVGSDPHPTQAPVATPRPQPQPARTSQPKELRPPPPTPASPALSGTTAVASPQLMPLHFDDQSWPKHAQTLAIRSKTPPASATVSRLHHNSTESQENQARCQPKQLPQRYASAVAWSCKTASTTASTQIGEIPLHRWPVRPDFDEFSAHDATEQKCTDGIAEYTRLSGMEKKSPRRGLFAKIFRKTPVAQADV